MDSKLMSRKSLTFSPIPTWFSSRLIGQRGVRSFIARRAVQKLQGQPVGVAVRESGGRSVADGRRGACPVRVGARGCRALKQRGLRPHDSGGRRPGSGTLCNRPDGTYARTLPSGDPALRFRRQSFLDEVLTDLTVYPYTREAAILAGKIDGGPQSQGVRLACLS